MNNLLEAKFFLPGAAVGVFELILSDIAAAITTTPLADGLWRMIALIPSDKKNELIAALDFAIEISETGHIAIEWNIVAPFNWEKQTLLSPLRIERFWIHDHKNLSSPVASRAIAIEAGAAFGTGRHNTTAACLVALCRLAKSQQFNNIIDIGCGSAILAIAAAHLWPAKITASDIDPIAIKVASNNCRRNKMRQRINCVVADGLIAPSLRNNAPYDLIIANILARPLIQMAGNIAGSLSKHGYCVLSGLLRCQEKWVTHAFVQRGLTLACIIRRGEWSALILKL